MNAILTYNNILLIGKKTNTEFECKEIIYTLNSEKNIFLGDFVKALLKINNIANELERVAESISH